ncbi:hypothetical protein E2C01_017973 [Portunus trituberculatus]|uniref:Uncharacterized protein n=1 Tax=Portunus trituberculatus TaxID=210409 RepID=A0A5B7DTV7_PORTR|nr:hypothetical protein [Portunus trituberculatus]
MALQCIAKCFIEKFTLGYEGEADCRRRPNLEELGGDEVSSSCGVGWGLRRLGLNLCEAVVEAGASVVARPLLRRLLKRPDELCGDDGAVAAELPKRDRDEPRPRPRTGAASVVASV